MPLCLFELTGKHSKLCQLTKCALHYNYYQQHLYKCNFNNLLASYKNNFVTERNKYGLIKYNIFINSVNTSQIQSISNIKYYFFYPFFNLIF